MELREYVRACRRRWPWLLVPVLVAMVVAGGIALTAPPTYRSSMVLFITTGSSDPDAAASRLNSYIALLTGPRVAGDVAARLGPPMTADRVQGSLSAQVQSGTDLLVVTATDPDRQRSRQIVTGATAALVALAKRLDPPGAAAAGGGPAPQVSVAQDVVTTRAPTNLARNLVFSAVLGLLAGAVAVAVRQATHKTVTDEDDLRRLGLGTVGVIAIGRNAGPPGEAIAEAFRRLRGLLALPPPMPGPGPRGTGGRGTSLLLTGSHAKEGTTAVACGLAIAMAETGARVVLVDANLRTPGVGRYLAMDPSPGLADVLAGRHTVTEVLRDPLDGRLTVLPCGRPQGDPGVLLASPRLGSAVRSLTEAFDVVLVDGPPLDGVADTVVLSKVTDQALLVVRAGRAVTSDVERSKDLLERVGARLAGAVLNALPRKLPTSPAWHRPRAAVPPGSSSAGLGLVTGESETVVVVPPPSEPVRGRAAVAVVPPGKPRGQATVINGVSAPLPPDQAGDE